MAPKRQVKTTAQNVSAVLEYKDRSIRTGYSSLNRVVKNTRHPKTCSDTF